MPGFDGTGPRGLGRMTGRGAGYCSGFRPRKRSFLGLRFGRGYRGRRGNRFFSRLTGLPGRVFYEYDKDDIK